MIHNFTFGEALNLAKTGVAVSSENFDLVDRVTGIDSVKYVPADQIWSPENRRLGALLHGPSGDVAVKPYFTKFTREGIENYIPSNDDMASQWMLSDYHRRCISITNENTNDGLGMFCLDVAHITGRDHLSNNLPFWMLYDQEMVGYHHNAYFIAGDCSSNITNATIFNLLSKAANNRKGKEVVSVSFDADLHFLKNGWESVCDKNRNEYYFINVDEQDFDIDVHFNEVDKPVNIFIDRDSLSQMNLVNGDNAHDFVVNQCILLQQEYPLINWVSFSLSEELSNSADLKELLETQNQEQSADNETFALGN